MTVTIWRFTDGKPGHDSQSIGLCSAIGKLKDCQHFDIPAESLLSCLKSFLFKRFTSGEHLPDPDIIIGAGHKTHISMLSARYARGGKIIVLMRPSLPFSLFDLCIIPKHDGVNEKHNVITTSGALNPIRFNDKKKKNLGLILLGGPSAHYQWDNENINEQIKFIVTDNKLTNWKIADSPRTPEETLPIIAKNNYSNVELLSHEKTDTLSLHQLIVDAGSIWVSSDSISMIYESLSSGAAIGLLDVPQRKETRLSHAVKKLILENQITTFDDWRKTKTLKENIMKLAEAERCTQILMEKGLLG